MKRYIKLYEEYKKDLGFEKEETSHTWTQIRDAVQTKIPFIIVNFKNKESYLQSLRDNLFSDDYIKQVAKLSYKGQLLNYPSIFMILEDDVKFKNKIPQIFKKYKVKSLILGKKGDEYIDYYFEDGSSSPAGNEIVSSINLDEMGGDEHFKLGSTYYKFINFSE
jgi:hypothetical protein